MSGKRPTLDIEKFYNQEKLSELENFIVALRNRTLALFSEMDKDEIPKEIIVFETLLSIFSSFEDGFGHEDILEAYPVEAWREETVTIPKSLIRPIVEAWVKYKEAPEGVTLGECFNLEGGGQGKSPSKRKLQKINHHANLANLALIEYLAESASPKRISWEVAIGRIAGREGVSESTVKYALETHKKSRIESYRGMDWLKE